MKVMQYIQMYGRSYSIKYKYINKYNADYMKNGNNSKKKKINK